MKLVNPLVIDVRFAVERNKNRYSHIEKCFRHVSDRNRSFFEKLNPTAVASTWTVVCLSTFEMGNVYTGNQYIGPRVKSSYAPICVCLRGCEEREKFCASIKQIYVYSARQLSAMFRKGERKKETEVGDFRNFAETYCKIRVDRTFIVETRRRIISLPFRRVT